MTRVRSNEGLMSNGLTAGLSSSSSSSSRTVAVAGFEDEGTAVSSSRTVAVAGFEDEEVDGVFADAGFESTEVASGPPSFSKAFASWKDTPKIVTSQVVFTGSDCEIV